MGNPVQTVSRKYSMSVKRLSLLFFTGALASGCSLSDTPDNSWASPTAWFSDSETNPLETEQVTVATGDEDLKQSVESGNGENATADAALDDAIAPELRPTAREAREKLDDPEQKIVKEAPQPSDLWNRLRAGFALNHDVDNKRVQDQLNWYASHQATSTG